MKKLFFTIFFLATLNACVNNPERLVVEEKNGIPVANIYASAETLPVTSSGDAADDPAIWWHPTLAEKSQILGTNKQKGLLVYGLDGDLTQNLEVGRVNNVDLRSTGRFDDVHSVAIASNRTANTLSVFSMDDDGNLSFVGDHALALPEPYGTCMYKAENDQLFAFVNDKNGTYQQWKLDSLIPLSLTLVREFKVNSQPEGCVAHDAMGTLFFGEEEFGVWKLDLTKPTSKPELLATVGDGVLVADVEGMDLYLGAATNYLVVSSQGDHSYAVYDVGETSDSFDYKGSFRIVLDEQSGIDGSQETDGLAVSSLKFGTKYPKGLLVVQDGFNRKPKQPQNFKIVDWRSVEEALSLP